MTAFTRPLLTWQALLASCILVLLSACGGGGGGGTASDPSMPSLDVVVGGTVEGLSGTVVLRNNLSQDLTVNTSGSFIFPTRLVPGSAYSISVAQQPVGQDCTAVNASGMANTDVTNVSVTCHTKTYVLTVHVQSLTSAITLASSLGESLPVTGTGTYTFGKPVNHNQAFTVSVQSGAGQLCASTDNTGTASGQPIVIHVACLPQNSGEAPTPTPTPTPIGSFSISGNVTGLSTPNQLHVLNNDVYIPNGYLWVQNNGPFQFPTLLPAGSRYDVISYRSGDQTCTVANGSGIVTGNVNNISITCSPLAAIYTVSITVTGLTGTLSLIDYGPVYGAEPYPAQPDRLTVTSTGGSTVVASFPKLRTFESIYSVGVLAHPIGQYCYIRPAAERLRNNVNVAVECS